LSRDARFDEFRRLNQLERQRSLSIQFESQQLHQKTCVEEMLNRAKELSAQLELELKQNEIQSSQPEELQIEAKNQRQPYQPTLLPSVSHDHTHTPTQRQRLDSSLSLSLLPSPVSSSPISSSSSLDLICESALSSDLLVLDSIGLAEVEEENRRVSENAHSDQKKEAMEFQSEFGRLESSRLDARCEADRELNAELRFLSEQFDRIHDESNILNFHQREAFQSAYQNLETILQMKKREGEHQYGQFTQQNSSPATQINDKNRNIAIVSPAAARGGGGGGGGVSGTGGVQTTRIGNDQGMEAVIGVGVGVSAGAGLRFGVEGEGVSGRGRGRGATIVGFPSLSSSPLTPVSLTPSSPSPSSSLSFSSSTSLSSSSPSSFSSPRSPLVDVGSSDPSANRLLRLRFDRVSAVKNKLSGGSYVFLCVLYDRVGGSPLRECRIRLTGVGFDSNSVSPSFSSVVSSGVSVSRFDFCHTSATQQPFRHSGKWNQVEMKFSSSAKNDLYFACPSRAKSKGTEVILMQLIQIRTPKPNPNPKKLSDKEADMPSYGAPFAFSSSSSSFSSSTLGTGLSHDRVVAWGVFPLLHSDGSLISGRFKTPLLRGTIHSNQPTHIDTHETRTRTQSHRKNVGGYY